MSDAFMYPVVDTTTWAARYALPIKTNPCKNCGVSLTADIPFASGTWRGLTSKPHGCEENYDLFVATKSDNMGKQKLKGMFYNLQEGLV